VTQFSAPARQSAIVRRHDEIETIRTDPEIASTSAKDLSIAMAEAGRKVTTRAAARTTAAYRDEYVRNSRRRRGDRPVKLQTTGRFGRLGEALRQHLKSLEAARAEFDKRARCGARNGSSEVAGARGPFRLETAGCGSERAEGG